MGDPPLPRGMHIGEVAARTELSLRTLRHWDDVGLLQPSARTEAGYRLYTEKDVETILVIRRMKPLGFSLEEMADVMTEISKLRQPDQDPTETANAIRRLTRILDQAKERRIKLRQQFHMAEEFIDLLTQELS